MNFSVRRIVPLFLFSLSALHGVTLEEMKHDLHKAEVELQAAHLKVRHLRETIAKQEIATIRKSLKALPQEADDQLSFLDLQRLNISSIMMEVPTCITEAQAVLDDILILITALKEESERALKG